ncbi:ABC transporter permease [Frigidibacter sp. ROC022]|uniref:ABC transporter permease n=1 Tax=Frigidibacter sp. ROC022 TaxID=2971796 RepID=UPI00215B62F5|nr:ABC transporter permease [Frigidibacter sp. ROC022]MCR8723222.1 ABC transporter permease [Frigidibacter sp. ROC022]
MKSLGPVLTVVAALLALWYAAAVVMNAQWTYDQAERAGTEVTLSELLADTMTQRRPKLPAPHQVLSELKKTVIDTKVTSKRSLVYQASITLGATLTGFLTGTLLGIALAVAVVRSRVMELSVTPWAIISQTIPIVALAPMIVVLSSRIGIEGRLIPKTVIAAYLSYFPVFVSMVKGLRSPDAMQLDLLRTYGAAPGQVFRKLRLPASLPYFFAAMKISMAASLVGVIVAELPTGAVQGLGSRLLIGSQNGQPLMIWAALVVASALGAGLILMVGLLERLLGRMMGVRA